MERKASRLAMMPASVEERSISIDETVTGNEVVVEHRRCAAAQVAGGDELELNLDVVLLREPVPQVVERFAPATLTEETRPPHEDEELDIIVGQVVSVEAKDAAFTASISASEDDALEEVVGQESAETDGDVVADDRELQLQLRTAVECVAFPHAAR